MKLHHFVASEPAVPVQKLRELGKALAATAPVVEAKKPVVKKAEPKDDDLDAGMDAAIHTMTQDQKHLHKKIAHHD